MELVIISDSHGKTDKLDAVLSLYPLAKAYIHCGDIGLDSAAYPMLQTVKGNNDTTFNYPDELLLHYDNHVLLVVHGHLFNTNKRKRQLVEYAKSKQADIVCYGHSHLADIEKIEGVLLVNPGALWRSLGGRGASFAIIDLTYQKITARIVYLNEQNGTSKK